jgi:glycine betaine/choline ABC-type transport system substrate-binding protein
LRVINAVNRRLATSAMIEMNRGVGVDSQDEALVAEPF